MLPQVHKVTIIILEINKISKINHQLLMEQHNKRIWITLNLYKWFLHQQPHIVHRIRIINSMDNWQQHKEMDIIKKAKIINRLQLFLMEEEEDFINCLIYINSSHLKLIQIIMVLLTQFRLKVDLHPLWIVCHYLDLQIKIMSTIIKTFNKFME